MSEAYKLKPVIKSYIWGGNYFQKYGKGDEESISELWEMSARGDDSSIIVSGPNSGKRLADVITNEDIGPVYKRFPYFPLLIKLIDAESDLSVQVHPSDDYALKNDNSFGKCEMWYIIDADEGSGIYIGLKEDSSREKIEQQINDGSILNSLNFVKVKPGDTFIINPGTIHAIGHGVRLIEIQQNSNLTYRLFDYNRIDKNGKKRELHILKALDVIDYKKYKFEKIVSDILADCKYFRVFKEEVNGSWIIDANQESFVSCTFLSGSGFVDDIPYKQFDTFFVPFGNKCEIKGNGTIIISGV